MSVTRFLMAAGALALATSLGLSAQTQSTRPKGDPDAPTFASDVAPILYKNCVGCHRPGEIAPMSLLTYDEARPWAKAIRDEVSEGNMPPWHAAPSLLKLRDERRLTDTERQTLIRWANTGAAKGDPKAAPPVRETHTG